MLFVNAGITRFIAVENIAEQDYNELFATNAKGPYFTVQRLAPLMRTGSAIVITTSVANAKDLAMSSADAATKAALRSMTRSFARKLQPHGVRVNAVSPGPIDTGMRERCGPGKAAATACELGLRSRRLNRHLLPRQLRGAGLRTEASGSASRATTSRRPQDSVDNEQGCPTSRVPGWHGFEGVHGPDRWLLRAITAR
jgi:NAD(P)-dependent dehydrogenase (short-subunit alcohol dehydrogenase family)